MSQTQRSPIGKYTALTASILAVSMVMIDQTIVAICGPAIQAGLGISHDALQWGINSYVLATAATFALGGKLADRFGDKRMALLGTAGFLVSSVLCSLTPSGGPAAGWLIAARVLQGASGGLMFPAALGIVAGSVDSRRRGSAMAWFFAITGAMTAIGPIVGGYLADVDWRAIFWINVPIAVLALLVLSVTSVSRTRSRAPIDLRGAVLIAVGMTLLILGVQQSTSWPQRTALTVAAAGACVLLMAFALEARTKHPLVQLRRFQDAGFAASAAAVTLASAAMIPLFFFISVYGQVSQGLSPQNSGLAMLKFFIGFVVGSRVGARIFDRRGAGIPLMLGGAIGAGGFYWWASIMGDLSFDASKFVGPQLWPAIMAGAGIGLMLTPASTDGLNRGDSSSYGEITGIFQTLRNFGAAVGLAAMSAVVTQQFTDKLTTSFGKLGAPRSAAECVANSIGGGRTCATGGGHEGSPSAAFTHAVQSGYADSVHVAFLIMAAAMIGVALLGKFVHPGNRTAVAEPQPDAYDAALRDMRSRRQAGSARKLARR